MNQTLSIQTNGQTRVLENLTDPSTLEAVVAAFQLKYDRVAIELNSEIIRRADWAITQVRTGDRIEIVHFVGGGRGNL